MDRREVLRWMASATAAISALDLRALRQDPEPRPAAPTGYGSDPAVNAFHEPGAFWPLTFTAAQRRCASALCDCIIPADARSPAASEVRVPDFIDEWVSAPYPRQQQDRAVVLHGLGWLDGAAAERFGRPFADLDGAQQRAICDDICSVARAKPELRAAAEFFALFRNLTAGAFYSTRVGMADVGYVGNAPRAAFAGPPPEVLAKLGLA